MNMEVKVTMTIMAETPRNHLRIRGAGQGHLVSAADTEAGIHIIMTRQTTFMTVTMKVVTSSTIYETQGQINITRENNGILGQIRALLENTLEGQMPTENTQKGQINIILEKTRINSIRIMMLKMDIKIETLITYAEKRIRSNGSHLGKNNTGRVGRFILPSIVTIVPVTRHPGPTDKMADR
jgi:hypothetical protein